jgi:hypothetical protein
MIERIFMKRQSAGHCAAVGIILLLVLGLNWQARSGPAVEPNGFNQRRQMILDGVWKDFQEHRDKPSANQSFFRAEVLFELGKEPEGRRLVHRGLDQLVPGNRENRWIEGGNSGFIAWPGMDCYLRYERFLDDTIKQRYRTIYTGAVFYRRLSTSNHKIMAAVTRYLATQVWGENAFRPDSFFEGKQDSGSRFEKSDPTGEKYIRQIIEETVGYGPGEYASRPYGAQNMLPLLTLAECAKDPIIRSKARLAYEYTLIELAPSYLRGHLATFSPRSYPDMLTQQPWGVAALLWVYFGGVSPSDPQNEWALRAATADYRLAEIIRQTGTDRLQPYIYRSLVNRWALYHYVNKSYVLFSRSPKAASDQFMGQSYPCGVMWDEGDVTRGSHLWVTNPSADDNEEKENSPAGLHTHGVTRYEQQVQYKDALLSAYDIPHDFRNPYVLVQVPGGYRAAINDSRSSHRIFLHYGSVLISLASTHSFEWDPTAGIRAPAEKPHAGDSEFRVLATKTAVAVETGLPEDFGGTSAEDQLKSFRKSVLEKSSIELKTDKWVQGRYTDRQGNTLECRFNGADKINGQNVDYQRWPTLENPWMKQSFPGSVLTITNGSRKRVYDFRTWTVTETP